MSPMPWDIQPKRDTMRQHGLRRAQWIPYRPVFEISQNLFNKVSCGYVVVDPVVIMKPQKVYCRIYLSACKFSAKCSICDEDCKNCAWSSLKYDEVSAYVK